MGPPCPAAPPHELRFVFLSCVLALFGIFYSIFGFRCLRAVGFISGLGVGTGAVLIAIAVKQGPIFGGPGDAALAVCCGLVGALIGSTRFIAPLLCGILAGGILGATALAIYYLIAPLDGVTVWSAASVLGGSAIVYALFSVHWTKGLTILSTSILGIGLILISADYFLQNFGTIVWLWDFNWQQNIEHQLNNTTTETPSLSPNVSVYSQTLDLNTTDVKTYTTTQDIIIHAPCWTWVLLLLWLPLTIMSMVIQSCGTARGLMHSGRKRTAGAQRNRPRTREARAEVRQKKYRYLYQVRTAHGDVISQSYVAALQRKAHPGATGGPGESSTLQSDATHLTILPGDHPESEGETGSGCGRG